MLTKDQIIEQIQSLNPTAGRDWLSEFNEDALQVYLDHLQTTIEPRGTSAAWLRPGDTPAVVSHKPAA